MSEGNARRLAAILGGFPWQSGGGMWLVIRKRADGKIVVFSDQAVCEFEDENAFEQNEVWNSILLA